MSRIVGDFLDTDGKNKKNWEQLVEDNDAYGSHKVRRHLEDYTETTLQRRVLEENEMFVRAEVHSENSFVQYEKIAGKEARRREIYEGETFVFPMWRQGSQYSKGTRMYSIDPMNKWESFEDSIEIPLMMFSGACADQDISFIGTIYEHFPEPGRKNPANIKANKIKLDSRVITLRISANRWNAKTEEFDPACAPDSKLLYRKRLVISLATKSKKNSGRKLMFHQKENMTTIRKRMCAIWNYNIGMFGAWDTENIETVQVDEEGALCLTDTIGTYAIIAEKKNLPYDYDEESWVNTSKLVGYGVSNFFLLIFLIMIFFSGYVFSGFCFLTISLLDIYGSNFTY